MIQYFHLLILHCYVPLCFTHKMKLNFTICQENVFVGIFNDVLINFPN